MTKERFKQIFIEEGYSEDYAEDMWNTRPAQITDAMMDEGLLRLSCKVLKKLLSDRGLLH